MIIEQLIAQDIPTLQPEDTGNRALHLMEESNLLQLPVVVDNKYTALLRESDLLNLDTPEIALSATNLLSYRPALFVGNHPYEALRLLHQQQLNVVPVVDEEQQYLGSVTRDTLLEYISANSGLDAPGGIIVLELAPRNYSLAEIARICENEEVTILISTMVSNPVTAMLEVTLKTNRLNLEPLIASFERHEYTVKEVYGAQTDREDIMDRYKLLMNYLNM